MCVAQVRAVTHLSALTVMSTNHAPGEIPKVVEVKGDSHFSGARTLSITTLSIMTLSIMTLDITTLSMATLSIAALG